MWFKNLRIYRLTQTFDLSGEALAEKLQAFTFKPCGKSDTIKLGWVSAAGKTGTELTHSVEGSILLCLKKQEKLLPSAVVNELLDEKVQQIESNESRKVYRKEKQQLKEEITFELLPKAFSRSKKLHGYIDTKHQLLIINTASASQADDFLNLLRESLGSLPVLPFSSNHEPSSCMTQWVSTYQPPEGFQLGLDCELQDPLNNQNKIRVKHQELDNGELTAALEAGKRVTQLMLEWQESIIGLIDSDLSIRRLKFTDTLQEQLDEYDGDEMLEFDASFALMTLELGKYINALGKAFGGIDTQA